MKNLFHGLFNLQLDPLHKNCTFQNQQKKFLIIKISTKPVNSIH